MEFIKKAKWGYIILSVIYIILGVILLIYPSQTIDVICRIIGATAVICGAYMIMKFFFRGASSILSATGLVFGVFCLVCGIILIASPDFVKSILPFIIGIVIIIDSAFKLMTSFEIKNTTREGWIGVLVLSVIGLVFGFLIVFNAGAAADFVVRIIGVSLIIEAIENLCATAVVSGKFRSIKKSLGKKSIEGEFTEIKTEPTDKENDK